MAMAFFASKRWIREATLRRVACVVSIRLYRMVPLSTQQEQQSSVHGSSVIHLNDLPISTDDPQYRFPNAPVIMCSHRRIQGMLQLQSILPGDFGNLFP